MSDAGTWDCAAWDKLQRAGKNYQRKCCSTSLEKPRWKGSVDDGCLIASHIAGLSVKSLEGQMSGSLPSERVWGVRHLITSKSFVLKISNSS